MNVLGGVGSTHGGDSQRRSLGILAKAMGARQESEHPTAQA